MTCNVYKNQITSNKIKYNLVHIKNHRYARFQVKVDRNKYLILNRCPLGNYEY